MAEDRFNSKTVLILDKHPSFSQSSNHRVDFEVFHKNKTSHPLVAAIFKSLWTCNVEAVLQYVRIVYDLFPSDKPLHLIVNDNQATAINTSNLKTQNLQHISLSLALKTKDYHNKTHNNQQHNVVNGILLALKILSECTSQSTTKGNEGRIVVLGSFGGDEGVGRLEECVKEALRLQNQLVLDGSTTIEQVQLVLIDIVPLKYPPSVTPHPPIRISEHLTSEVLSSQSGEVINDTMVQLVMQHFGLVVTTVTGIPMKEEQNVHSSANYDVPLLHSREAHKELASMALLPKPLLNAATTTTAAALLQPSLPPPAHQSSSSTSSAPPSSSSSSLPATTIAVPLKWCTPKNTTTTSEHCTHAHRATPLDVTSRPSLCLTNFLLAGRSVMLELNKPPTRLLSHMLTSHAGEIFIHTLATFRSPIDHPPSISDGPGGRLTDYRVQDYGEILKMIRLVPNAAGGGEGAGGSNSGGGGGGERVEPAPIDKGKQLLERLTRYWPLTMTESLIFNMASVIKPLTTNLVKKSLSELEVVDCLKVIYQVVSMKTKNEPLNIASSLRIGKSNKREDQYKQVWAELEKLIRCHSDNSANHQRVLTCLLDFKKPDPIGGGNDSSSGNNNNSNATADAGNSSDSFGKSPARIEESKTTKPLLKKASSESLETPSQSKKFKPLLSIIFSDSSKSFSKAYKEFCIGQIKTSKLPFSGISKAVNNKTELYQHLKNSADDDGVTKSNNNNNKVNNSNSNNGNNKGNGVLKKSYKLLVEGPMEIE